MGIAGFFLWLQRFYESCINDVPPEVVEAAIANKPMPSSQRKAFRYDNFYVDMNGLIHPCCHDTHPLPEPESEEEMLSRIFQQLDLLVKVVRPRKCLVLCVDGVAPRSKMNQQRSRRFRAADERLESDAITSACAARIEAEFGLPRPHMRNRWDHNVITPSTDFMERVGMAIEWFIMKKLNEDPVWRNLAVVFSDAHVPGEGEHKIMHYIRGLRTQPGYDPSTSHVIHGMDADLVCLGLSTHEEHVSILRNQLTETFQPDHSRFCYFNLHAYRESLMNDFGNIPDMNFERVVDDFIFLCFFVGNDFLPHVPLISIKTKGIELLLDHYVRGFATHEYLTDGGEVNFKRLHIFLKNFITSYMGKLQVEYRGILRASQRAKINVGERITNTEAEVEVVKDSVDEDNAQEVSDRLLSLLTSAAKERSRFVHGQHVLPFSYLDDDYRDAYYQQKFGWSMDNRDVFEANIRRCCGEYLRGMQWVMRYYTKGCPSWSWYYPYHYAPLLEDMAKYKEAVFIDMELSAPLHPVEQLLAVLPRPSVAALPEPLHDAVMDPSSVLGPFYPDRVEVDFSEANFAYQGVLRIPFIDCVALHSACGKLVEVEEDAGTTLVFCHETHPMRPKLDQLIASSSRKHKGLVPISKEITSITPMAGRIGLYASEWPRHAKLRCPDEGIAKETNFGKSIRDNAVCGYVYELDTTAEYRQELLRPSAVKRGREEVEAEDTTPAKKKRATPMGEEHHTASKGLSSSPAASLDTSPSPQKKAKKENKTSSNKPGNGATPTPQTSRKMSASTTGSSPRSSADITAKPSKKKATR